MISRLLATILGAGALAGTALGVQHANEKATEADADIEIPDWKVDLVTGKEGDNWWTKHVTEKFKDIKSMLWGTNLPQVTASKAQDQQRCPIIKLPGTFHSAAKHSSWNGLYGEWTMGNDVTVATFEQNYLMMGFSRNVNRVSVLIRAAASGEVAFRTRPFSDEEMKELYNWKAVGAPNGTKPLSPTNATNATPTTLQTYKDWNLAIFDCVGTLMYVVREKKGTAPEIQLYSRDGTLVSKSVIGNPVLRYQFVDPSSGYLIATAEAPGINASINRTDIPKEAMVGDVLPFGFQFEQGGYANSSALMEIEYRWVLATAVEALAIYNAESVTPSWTLVTVVEAFLIACFIFALLTVGGAFVCIFRCVFPGGYSEKGLTDYYGRLAENPFLAQKSKEWDDIHLTKRAGVYDHYGAMQNMAAMRL